MHSVINKHGVVCLRNTAAECERYIRQYGGTLVCPDNCPLHK